MKIKFILLLLIGLSLAGCLENRSPEVAYKDYQVAEMTPAYISANFYFEVYNPNNIDLETASYKFELFITDKKIMSEENPGFKLQAKATTELEVPVKVEYSKVFVGIEEMIKYVLQDKTTIPYTLKGNFVARAAGFQIPIPFETRGDLPLPKREELEKEIRINFLTRPKKIF
jgi:LEA14-like dessication related protein